MSNFLSHPSEPTRILKQPEYKEVQRGRSVVFECTVKHDPSLIPTMTWLKDDGELPDDERSNLFWCLDMSPVKINTWSFVWYLYTCGIQNSVKQGEKMHVFRSHCAASCLYRLIVDSDSLTITDVTEDDAGVYTCIMNTTLDHDSATATLTVVGT